jgi:hypothetical protein
MGTGQTGFREVVGVSINIEVQDSRKEQTPRGFPGMFQA